MSDVLNAVKSGYLAAVTWIENHPHLTLWLASASLFASLVMA